jgi:hypothetical protein
MVDTPGRCRELDYCSIGQMRTLVRVPLGQPFVCPECGKPLREPVLINEPLSRKRLALWSVGTVGLFVLLYECVAPSPKHHVQLAELQQQQARRLAAASAPVAKPAPPPQPAPQAQPEPRQPAIAAPPAAGHGTAPGVRVTMECSIDAAGVPSNCVRVQHQDLPPPSPPPPPPAKPAAARPAVTASPPPPVSPTDREPSYQPVAGGSPPYPSDYVRDGRPGEVSLTCLILASGEPQNCRVADYIGGRRFAEAVVKWLNTGQVRFRPAVRGGHPVAEERHWHITFAPR